MTAQTVPAPPRRVILRRNVPLRLAGAGYAAITLGWLLASLGHGSLGAALGEVLFGVLALVGLGLASFRDDLTFENGTVETIRGLGPFARRSREPLEDYDHLAVEEEGAAEYEEGTVRPVRRAWVSVVLVRNDGPSLRVWTADCDESEPARVRLRERAGRKANALSRQIGVPIVGSNPA